MGRRKCFLIFFANVENECFKRILNVFGLTSQFMVVKSFVLFHQGLLCKSTVDFLDATLAGVAAFICR